MLGSLGRPAVLLGVLALTVLVHVADARLVGCRDGGGLGSRRSASVTEISIRHELIDIECDVDRTRDDTCVFAISDPFCVLPSCVDQPMSVFVPLGGRRRATSMTEVRHGIRLRLRCVCGRMLPQERAS